MFCPVHGLAAAFNQKTLEVTCPHPGRESNCRRESLPQPLEVTKLPEAWFLQGPRGMQNSAPNQDVGKADVQMSDEPTQRTFSHPGAEV